jgi:hypothetical protein
MPKAQKAKSQLLRVWTCRFSGAASDRAAPRTAERDASCCVVHGFTRTGAHGPVRPCRAAPTRAEPSSSVRRARHQTPCGGKLDVLSSGLRCAAGARPPHAAGSNAELSRRWRARHGLERQWPWPQCSRFFFNGRSRLGRSNGLAALFPTRRGGGRVPQLAARRSHGHCPAIGPPEATTSTGAHALGGYGFLPSSNGRDKEIERREVKGGEGEEMVRHATRGRLLYRQPPAPLRHV